MRTMIHRGLVVTMLAGLLACDETPTQPKGSVGMMAITGAMSVTAIGQTFQLAATVTTPSGAIRDVTPDTEWASLDTSVATVTDAGLVTVVGIGLTSVSASYKTSTATRSVNALLPAQE